LPKVDSTRQRRARKPSIWSVIAAAPKTIAAAQLLPPSLVRSSAAKIGMTTIRASVSAFGSCCCTLAVAAGADTIQGYAARVYGRTAAFVQYAVRVR
jgi:hypothetical protein